MWKHGVGCYCKSERQRDPGICRIIQPNHKEDDMTLYEFSIIAVALAVLAGVRFGIPALIMWLLNQVSHHYTHA